LILESCRTSERVELHRGRLSLGEKHEKSPSFFSREILVVDLATLTKLIQLARQTLARKYCRHTNTRNNFILGYLSHSACRNSRILLFLRDTPRVSLETLFSRGGIFPRKKKKKKKKQCGCLVCWICTAYTLCRFAFYGRRFSFAGMFDY